VTKGNWLVANGGNRMQMEVIECNWRIQSNGMVAYFAAYIPSFICFMQPSTISAIAEYNSITMASCYAAHYVTNIRQCPTRAGRNPCTSEGLKVMARRRVVSHANCITGSYGSVHC